MLLLSKMYFKFGILMLPLKLYIWIKKSLNAPINNEISHHRRHANIIQHRNNIPTYILTYLYFISTPF